MRLSKAEWAMGLAVWTAKRSTCVRRSVGCVLVDEDHHLLSTGVNGVASGMVHCNSGWHTHVPGHPDDQLTYPHACPGAFSPSGSDLNGCHAIHAEQNALLQCPDVRRIDTCYCTASPCVTCVKLLMNTACRHIVFVDLYPHHESKDLWMTPNPSWVHLGPRTWTQFEGRLPTL